VEELKMDIDLTNPEITLNIDREKANTKAFPLTRSAMK
jgi:hypothetical protein